MWRAGFWIAVLLIIVCLRGVAYLEPDPSDAYRYAYVGAKWVDGLVPYRDLFENKPPAIYALNALAFAISRPHHWAVLNAVEVVLAVLTAVCLAGMVRRWVGRPWDYVVVLIAATLAFGLRFAYTGNMTEGYCVAWVVAGLWVIVVAGRTRSAWWMLLGGGLIGLGSLFKPTGLAAAIAVAIWLVTEWLLDRLDLRRALARVGLLIGGAIVPWLIAVAGFALYGLADEMLYASLAYNSHYGQEMWQTKGVVWIVLECYQQLWVALPVMAAAGYVVLTLVRPSRLIARGQAEANWRCLAVLWMLGDLGGALAGGRCYEHYFVPLMISASAVAGFALADAARSLVGLAEVRPARRIGLSVLILWLALLIGRDAIWGASLLRSGGPSPETRGRAELAQAAHYLARPGDTLFTWGSAAYFFYEARLDPIFPDMDTHRAYDFDAKAKQIALDLLAAFEAQPPRFIITDVNDDHPQRQQPDLLRAYETFKRVVQSDYRPILGRGPRSLYVRKEPPATTQSVTAPSSRPKRPGTQPTPTQPTTRPPQ